MSVPTASTEFAYAVLDYLGAGGITEDRVLEYMGLTHREQLCVGNRVPLDRYAGLFEAGEALSCDRYFGLNMGGSGFPRSWGLVSHLAMSAPNALTALTSLMKYAGLHLDFIRFEFIELETQELVLTWHSDISTPVNPQVIEHMFANVIQFASSHAGYSNMPLRFEFAHSDRGRPGYVAKVLNSTVEFECAHDCVFIPQRWLHRQSLHSQEELFLVTESLAQQRLKELRGRDKFVNAVRESILEQLLEGRPKVSETALALNTTTRTLQRRLREKHLSYQTLLDEVRRELAQHLMQDAKIALAEVAHCLGFNDQSAFHHAYRRWQGTTPAQFRKSC